LPAVRVSVCVPRDSIAAVPEPATAFRVRDAVSAVELDSRMLSLAAAARRLFEAF
jgi:hypothetical protein